jgi:hypothetical protein
MHATAGIPDRTFEALRVAVHLRHPGAESKIRLHVHCLKQEIDALIKQRLLQTVRPTTVGESMRISYEITARESAIGRMLELLATLEKSMPNERVKGPIEQWRKPGTGEAPIDRLIAKGKLDTKQYAAAEVIKWVVSETVRYAEPRTTQLDAVGGSPPWASRTPTITAVANLEIFAPWMRKVSKYDRTLVYSIVVDEIPVYRVAKRLKISRSRCISRLRKALDKL